MQKKREVSQILEHVRDSLKKRGKLLFCINNLCIFIGTKTIAGLGRTFRALDSYDGNKKVDSEEFKVGLRENGADLTDKEAMTLLDFFDKDENGHVDFDEFLVGIRGQLNDKRKAIVEKAFLKFNKDDSNDYIDGKDLEGVYDVRMHPKYESGQMTKEEIFDEFLVSMGDKDRDGKITKEEWFEYYAAVSSNIDNDEHFVLLMRNAWKLDE